MLASALWFFFGRITFQIHDKGDNISPKYMVFNPRQKSTWVLNTSTWPANIKLQHSTFSLWTGLWSSGELNSLSTGSLPLSLPFPCYFFPQKKNREPVHRLSTFNFTFQHSKLIIQLKLPKINLSPQHSTWQWLERLTSAVTLSYSTQLSTSRFNI